MKCSECERVEHVPSCSSANVSPSAERILLDLIAEINDKNHGCCGCGWADEAADRAEARLREVQHPLHDTHPHTPLLTPLFGQWRLLGWLGHIDLRRVRLGIRR